MHVCILFGGGIESAYMLHHYKQTDARITLLHFDYGQKAAFKERNFACKAAHRYQVNMVGHTLPRKVFESGAAIMSGDVGKTPADNVLPGRNVGLIGIGAVAASGLKCSHLAVGFHVEPRNTPFVDSDVPFARHVRDAVHYATAGAVMLAYPCQTFTHREVAVMLAKTDEWLFQQCHTCYENVEGGCGRCVHCKVKEEVAKCAE